MSTTYILRHQALENEDKMEEKQDFTATRAVQIGCVLRLLKDSIERIRISLILPKIFENVDQLSNYLADTQYMPVIGMIQNFLSRREKLARHKTTPVLDKDIVYLLDYFHENFKLLEFLPKEWTHFLKSDDRKLLIAFELLYDIASQHLQKTAKTELEKERKLHQMYTEKETMKASIAELKTKLKSQKLNLRWKMWAKEAYLKKFEEDLTNKKWQNNLRIQNEITNCSRLIRNNHKITMDKQRELEEELEKVKAEYEKAMKSNLSQETEARAEKNKLLLQLQGLLKKYDTTIGEKMRENLQLREEYEDAKKKIDEFMVIYNYEEAIYKDIVVKREEEEQREQQRRVLFFMMNRAARIIQRYYRHWRREQRKKAKKLGGKKKRPMKTK